MQKKLEKFDMKDIHSGYVVKFRNGKFALCMRAGEKFTKIFACTDWESVKRGAIEGDTFMYASRYKDYAYYSYSPVINQYIRDDTNDIVAVYGLIEGVRNYLNVGDTGPISIKNRPLLWEEEVPKKMTLAEIEKKLGHKVEIVEPEKPKPVGIKGKDCNRCAYRLRGSKCPRVSILCNNCEDCKKSLGLEHCPCNPMYAKEGEPCPYFEEDKE